VPFDPEKVLSQLIITIREATPEPSRPTTSSSLIWSPKTPYNARTLECQVKSVRKLFNMTAASQDAPSIQAFNQLVKGSLLNMHNTAILSREVHDLREAVDQLQKRRTRRSQRLQNERILTISEGQEVAQAALEAVVGPSEPAEQPATQPRQRGPPPVYELLAIGAYA
jgi:valyl-tRNA synthetase